MTRSSAPDCLSCPGRVIPGHGRQSSGHRRRVRRDTRRAVGHSLGGGIAMQFFYQHPEYCQRLVLVSSGGLGPDVAWVLRILSAPGAELVLPVIAPKLLLALGNKVRPWLGRTRLGSVEADQAWQAYSSLSERPTRSAFLHTLRSVVDYRGQAVSALSRLQVRSEVPTLVIWGARDPIIPVEHSHTVRTARPDSTVTVLPGLGFPHVQAPAVVASVIDEFIAANPVHEQNSVAERTLVEDLGGDLRIRHQIHVAVGLLMGLRGCSQSEAHNEFHAAVAETGLSAEALARALISIYSGTTEPENAADQVNRRLVVRSRWQPLLSARGLGHVPATIPPGLRARYGPSNESVMC
ncbi:alpha/beta fold hydrolase [Mycolicibacterium chubuense]